MANFDNFGPRYDHSPFSTRMPLVLIASTEHFKKWSRTFLHPRSHSPRPAEVEAAVHLGVELGLVDVELEGLRPRREDLVLDGVLEGGQLALDGGGVAVEHELHQLRVLQYVQLRGEIQILLTDL